MMLSGTQDEGVLDVAKEFIRFKGIKGVGEKKETQESQEEQNNTKSGEKKIKSEGQGAQISAEKG